MSFKALLACTVVLLLGVSWVLADEAASIAGSNAGSVTARPNLARLTRIAQAVNRVTTSSNTTVPSGNNSTNVSCDCAPVVPSISLQKIVDGLEYPTCIRFAIPPGMDREFMFVAEQGGLIHMVDIDSLLKDKTLLDGAATQWEMDQVLNKTLLLNISDKIVALLEAEEERGLIGLEFHPRFRDNGRMFIYYNSNDPRGVASKNASFTRTCDRVSPEHMPCNVSVTDNIAILAEYRVVMSNSSVVPVTNSTSNATNSTGNSTHHSSSYSVTWVRDIIQLAKPYSDNNGDNSIMFNPFDGMMYVGFGDGGCSYDPFALAQNPDSLFGKILRIDVDAMANATSNATSSNATSNATVTCDAAVRLLSDLRTRCPAVGRYVSIYAMGIKNPSGLEFTRLSASKRNSSLVSTGAQDWALIFPDVGMDAFDEINYVISPDMNLGWGRMEGFLCVDPHLVPCQNSTNHSSSAVNKTSTIAIQPISVLSHDDPTTYYEPAILGGYVYNGTISALRGKYIFASLASNVGGDFVGAGHLFFLNLADLTGTGSSWLNKSVDLATCDAATGVDYSIVVRNNISEPNSAHSPRGLAVNDLALQYIFAPDLGHFTGCMGANTDRSELFWAVSSKISPKAANGAIYRIVPAHVSPLGSALKDI